MSLEAFFKSLSMTNVVRESQIKGVAGICPANVSFQIKFDPDPTVPEATLTELKKIEDSAEYAEHRIDTRTIEIPVYYTGPLD